MIFIEGNDIRIEFPVLLSMLVPFFRAINFLFILTNPLTFPLFYSVDDIDYDCCEKKRKMCVKNKKNKKETPLAKSLRKKEEEEFIHPIPPLIVNELLSKETNSISASCFLSLSLAHLPKNSLINCRKHTNKQTQTRSITHFGTKSTFYPLYTFLKWKELFRLLPKHRALSIKRGKNFFFFYAKFITRETRNCI